MNVTNYSINHIEINYHEIDKSLPPIPERKRAPSEKTSRVANAQLQNIPTVSYQKNHKKRKVQQNHDPKLHIAINQHSNTFSELVRFCRANLNRLTKKNVIQALYRLAGVSNGIIACQQDLKVIDSLFSALHPISSCDHDQISLIAYAYRILYSNNIDLNQIIFSKQLIHVIMDKIDLFEPQQMIEIMKSFNTTGIYSLPLFQAIADAAVQKMIHFEPKQAFELIKEFGATALFCPTELFKGIGSFILHNHPRQFREFIFTIAQEFPLMNLTNRELVLTITALSIENLCSPSSIAEENSEILKVVVTLLSQQGVPVSEIPGI